MASKQMVWGSAIADHLLITNLQRCPGVSSCPPITLAVTWTEAARDERAEGKDFRAEGTASLDDSMATEDDVDLHT